MLDYGFFPVSGEDAKDYNSLLWSQFETDHARCKSLPAITGAESK